MIYVNQENVSEGSFVSLLETTKNVINTEYANGFPAGINGVAFEGVVYNKMVEASENTDFYGSVEQTGLLTFPDIVARKLYGVEVKMTVSDKWISTGNSVLETTRIETVETIYMFFGKFGRNFEARYRKYQDCLYDVGVTHSPRYKINMDLPEGESIFDKIGVPYNVFRKEASPIKRLKEYYRGQLREGEELWWIDPATEENTVSPVIRSLRLLDKDVRDRFLIECMILFPEIFGNDRNTKFERAAAYLITDYNAICSYLRDYFTSGGKKSLIIEGNTVRVPKILFHLYNRSRQITEVIEQMPSSLLTYYWNRPSQENRLNTWLALVNVYSERAVQVFNAGVVA